MEKQIQNLKRSESLENKQFLLIQFNCNGIFNKLSEIKLYIYTRKPEVFCFSETFVKKHEPKFIGYQSFWQHRVGHKGGLGTFIRRDIAAKSRTLAQFQDQQLELQCTQIFSSDQWIDIVNIYNPQKNVTYDEIKHITSQLTNNFIVIGDFNAHSPMWDTRGRSNITGRSIEQILTNSNINLLNDSSIPTYIDHRTNTTSCLDLCLATRTLWNCGELKRGVDLGSDHFPIECCFKFELRKETEATHKRWKYSTAKWSIYKQQLEKKGNLVQEVGNESTGILTYMPCDVMSHNAFITNAITSAAEIALVRCQVRK